MTTTTMTVLAAADGMVLCDGDSMTSVGGRVTLPAGAKASDWLEMTPEDAAELIKKNHPETEQDAADGE